MLSIISKPYALRLIHPSIAIHSFHCVVVVIAAVSFVVLSCGIVFILIHMWSIHPRSADQSNLTTVRCEPQYFPQMY